jgi:hypothetical protein
MFNTECMLGQTYTFSGKDISTLRYGALEAAPFYTITFVDLNGEFLCDLVPSVYEGVQKLNYYYDLMANYPNFWDFDFKVPAGFEAIPNIWKVLEGNSGHSEPTYEYMRPVLSNLTLTLLIKAIPQPTNLAVVNFPGISGVQMQIYVNGVWQTAFGNFENTTGEINIPDGTTSIRAIKNGMYYQIDGLKDQVYPKTFDLPVVTFRVSGCNQPGQVALVQGNWVYDYAPIVGYGIGAYYTVFDNEKDFEVRYWIDGKSPVTSGAFKIANLPTLPDGMPYIWFAPIP